MFNVVLFEKLILACVSNELGTISIKINDKEVFRMDETHLQFVGLHEEILMLLNKYSK